jgi:hypothetical protein
MADFILGLRCPLSISKGDILPPRLLRSHQLLAAILLWAGLLGVSTRAADAQNTVPIHSIPIDLGEDIPLAENRNVTSQRIRNVESEDSA